MADVTLSPEAQSILEAGSPFLKSQTFLHNMARRSSKRDTHYKTFEDYYTGENQRVRLTDRVRRWLMVSGFMWCENFCEVVIDALAERCILEAMDPGNDDDTIVADWSRELWVDCGLDELQSIVHTNTFMKGDGFVIIDRDSVTGRPTMHYNRPEIIKPIYDSEHPDLILVAAKVWKSELETPTNPNSLPVRRMNLYYANRVEKWFNVAADGGADWSQHLDLGDTQWPLPWTDTGELDGQPLGVPVFHFKNKSRGSARGVSEIRGTIPQQDALNKAILDLWMVSDQQGAPQRWATGIKQEERSAMRGNSGTMWISANPDAKFGQFEPARLEGMLANIEASLQRLAGRSRTPLFLLVMSGDAPSGESLKTAESGLVAKAKNRHPALGRQWIDAWRMCGKIAQVNGDLPDSVEIDARFLTPVWADPESRNDYQWRQSLSIDVGDLGLSKHTALTALGYDADEEQEMKGEETSTAVMNFNRGIPTLPVPGDQNGGPVPAGTAAE